ncbi:hypothetical protein H8D30_03385 [bacterium]|nr:hypothetical protein [bacterium]
MTRGFLVLGLLIGAAGCSSPDLDFNARNWTFHLDIATCIGSRNLTFFIDGTESGEEVLSPGEVHNTILIGTGAGKTYTGRAEDQSTGIFWRETAYVANGEVHTMLLTCNE